MKTGKHILLVVLSWMALLTSCESFLDKQPDDALTSEDLFDKKESTFKVLVDVYSHMFYYSEVCNSTNGSIMTSGSDECCVPYAGNRFFAVWNHQGMSPAYTHLGYVDDIYYRLYRGVTNASYFIDNVQRCKELTGEEVLIYRAEARFCRALFYVEMMRYFGPVFWTGEHAPDVNDPTFSTNDRTPWTELVDWLENELDLAAADLPVSWASTNLGRATKASAMGIKVRLLMMNARPLFNGQNDTHLYDDVFNKWDEPLFRTQYDKSQWNRAANAAKELIDASGELGIELLETYDTPILNYYHVFQDKTSPENLFVYLSPVNLRQQITPAGIGGNGHGGCSLTQKAVDMFAMENGVYPIKNIGSDNYDNGLGVIEVDPASGYVEEGTTSFVNPFFAQVPSLKQTDPITTKNMFIKREPRFYVNVFWGGQTWVSANQTAKDINFSESGKSGHSNGNNYTPTGYLPLKFTDPSLDTMNGKYGNICFPVMRYADVLLSYCEALNEIDPNNSDILKYWNMVRKRAGVPDIQNVYSGLAGNKEQQRKYILRERSVEFCFEGLRYHDLTQWMTAEKEISGQVVGCNIKSFNQNFDGTYWKRTSVFNCYGEGGYMDLRVFAKKNYLMPFNQTELNRCPTVTQNYGW